MRSRSRLFVPLHRLLEAARESSAHLVRGLTFASLALVPCAIAQEQEPGEVQDPVRQEPFVRAAPPEDATLYATGESVVTEWQEVWRPMCGSTVGALSPRSLARVAALSDALFANGPAIVVDSPGGDANINFVFNVSGNIPPGALTAIANAEAYMEAQFADPITATINLSFATLSPGVLGGTSSFYTQATWGTSRSGLQAGMDANDTLQSFLPAGSTIPVRYTTGTTVTAENRVYWTRCAYRSTIGSVTGNAASMQFNSAFAWDFDPSNGMNGGTYSFIDVLIHETGHAMGFTSGVDFRVNDIEALDIYRFQRTDGTGDFNPDTTAEFQTKARLVVWNAPNDNHNSDLISVEYRMSDGSPYQASHFREQAANIGIMDPAFASAQSYFPNYYKASDLNMFDAIGYDR